MHDRCLTPVQLARGGRDWTLDSHGRSWRAPGKEGRLLGQLGMGQKSWQGHWPNGCTLEHASHGVEEKQGEREEGEDD